MPISTLISLAIFFQIVPDVFRNVLFGLIDPEVPLAEDVGLQGQEHFHGSAPCCQFGAEFLGEGAVDILSEQDPFSSPIHVDGEGAGSVSRGVEADDLLVAEAETFFLLFMPNFMPNHCM